MKEIILILILFCNTAYCQISQKQEPIKTESSNLISDINSKKAISVFLPSKTKFRYLDNFGSYMVGNEYDSLKPVLIYTNEPIITYTSTSGIGAHLGVEKGITKIELFPGEVIQVIIDQQGESKLSVKNNVARSNELLFYYQNLLFSSKYDVNFRILKNRSFSSTIDFIDSVETARANYLKEYITSHTVTDQFFFAISKQIIESKYSSLAFLLLNSNETNRVPVSSLTEQLKRFYCKVDTISTIEHIYGASQLCKFLNLNELHLPNTLDNLFNTALKYFKGRTLDRLLYNSILQFLVVNNPSTHRFIELFYSKCKDVECIDRVKSEELKYDLANDKSVNDRLLTVNKSITSWSQLLKKYKGNVIYVDFWASWCVPCINEMPFLEKLKEQYADKGVTFISLSTDQKFSDWKGKVDQLKMDYQNSFILANGTNSLLYKNLEIKTIPRFILIDKNGKIVSKDACRPSDNNVNALIEQYLGVK